MQVIKRDGTQAAFDKSKIKNAITKSILDTEQKDGINFVDEIVERVINIINSYTRAVSVEQIQNIVEDSLIEYKLSDAVRSYIRYRYQHELMRKSNTTDAVIMSLVEYQNEEVKQENSNKNPEVIPTQRDYIAGEVARDFAKRMFFPPNIWKAHQNGQIHIHDTDYSPLLKMSNCCVFNLEDMLQNGTVISGVKIDKPHLFSTACNISLQAEAQIASSQYGGSTFTLSHLSPFVNETRNKFKQDYCQLKQYMSEDEYNQFIEKLVKEDIKKGVQTIQYQVITLMTTNGQAPFLSVFMYLDEVQEGQPRDDLAMVIEEVLLQRIQGVKNEQGVWITPAFPKLLYCLDEDNTYEGSKYYYLTQLAAKCTAKRMVPDYISAKKMREYKGDVYPCINKLCLLLVIAIENLLKRRKSL